MHFSSHCLNSITSHCLSCTVYIVSQFYLFTIFLLFHRQAIRALDDGYDEECLATTESVRQQAVECYDSVLAAFWKSVVNKCIVEKKCRMKGDPRVSHKILKVLYAILLFLDCLGRN